MEFEKEGISANKCFKITAISVLVLLFLCTIIYFVSGDDEDETVPKRIVPHSPTTFIVCDETDPKKHLYYNSSNKLTSDASVIIKPLVSKHQFYQVLQSTRFPQNSFLLSGFVRTVVDCHSFHHNLIIRPDDIWAAIMNQFSWYAYKNAEKLGSEFSRFKQEGSHIVQFETSEIFGTLPYEGMMFSLQKDISYVFENDTLRNWILPDFSTTTENDNVTIGLMFMGMMKTVLYKRTKILTEQCGMPFITLDGTVDDWGEIRRRLEKLNGYGLQKWYGLLHPIITQFMEAKDGNPDTEFWKEIVQFEELDYQYVTGWITAFCVFYTLQSNEYGGVEQQQNQNLEWFSTSDHSKKWPAIVFTDIPGGVAQMDAKILKRDENGKIYKGVLLAGHLAAELKEDGETIQPALGWAMVLQRGRSG